MEGSILGAFVKLRKATVSFFMSVRPSARNHRLSLDGLSRSLIFNLLKPSGNFTYDQV
jgi:hypothetical protein